MSRKILIVLSEWGYWGEELIGPLETFDAAGYESVYATPTGKRPMALPSAWTPVTSIRPWAGQSPARGRPQDQGHDDP